jgi:hypothetical protein
VSGSFGGSVLSQIEKQALALSEELSYCLNAVEGDNCGAADIVLIGLGGAPQESQQPAFYFLSAVWQ